MQGLLLHQPTHHILFLNKPTPNFYILEQAFEASNKSLGQHFEVETFLCLWSLRYSKAHENNNNNFSFKLQDVDAHIFLENTKSINMRFY